MAATGADVAPTVVLLGGAGSGKSTVVEKVTGIRGLSSISERSFTLCSRVYPSPGGRLRITDTPGGNSIGETVRATLHTNIYIAQALSAQLVSLLVIVVKAETRIDAVVSMVRPYSETFEDFGDNVAVIVTHMDTVRWTAEACTGYLKTALDLELVLFVGLDTPGETIVRGLLGLCQKVKPVDIRIDSGNFFKFFKIQDSSRRILSCVRKEVEDFRQLVQQFDEKLLGEPEADRADAVFEFQAFATKEIYAAQARVSDANELREEFLQPDKAANAAGHLSSLTLQLRIQLVNVRKIAFRYQSESLRGEQGTSDLRKCPHCGLVWALLADCEKTTCGNPMNALDAPRGEMATFAFSISIEQDSGLRRVRLHMARKGPKAIKVRPATGRGIGCGGDINWLAMKVVSAPEFTVQAAEPTANDVPLLRAAEERAWAEIWAAEFAAAMRNAESLQRGGRPAAAGA